MRVAVVAPEIEPLDDVEGGAVSRVIHETLSAVDEPGVEAVVFSASSGRSSTALRGPYEHRTYTFYRPPPALAYRVPGHYASRVARDVLRDRSFDVVEVHNRPAVATALRAAGYTGRIVLRLHNQLSPPWTQSLPLRSLAEAVDLFVPVSAYLLQALRQLLPLDADVRGAVLPGGVDCRSFHPGQVREPGPVTACFVGRLTPEKGPLHLLRLIAARGDELPDMRLVMAGSAWFGRRRPTPYEQEVRSLATTLSTRHGLEVDVVGQLGHGALAPLLRRADFFVYPGQWPEPLGLVNLEAMASGLPVVGYAQGGVPEAVGDGGVLVAPDDDAGLIDAVRTVATDPVARRALSLRARRRALSHFDWPVLAHRWAAMVVSA